jgi:hypothetical protein
MIFVREQQNQNASLFEKCNTSCFGNMIKFMCQTASLNMLARPNMYYQGPIYNKCIRTKQIYCSPCDGFNVCSTQYNNIDCGDEISNYLCHDYCLERKRIVIAIKNKFKEELLEANNGLVPYCRAHKYPYVEYNDLEKYQELYYKHLELFGNELNSIKEEIVSQAAYFANCEIKQKELYIWFINES